jgi:hypothetical protein
LFSNAAIFRLAKPAEIMASPAGQVTSLNNANAPNSRPSVLNRQAHWLKYDINLSLENINLTKI